MISLRKLGLLPVLVALTAAPASAGPGEPTLVVEKLADPDPGFVPPPPEKFPARAQRRATNDPTLDEAFENLGRVAGEAAQMAERRARSEARRLNELACRSLAELRSSGMDVSKWEKDC